MSAMILMTNPEHFEVRYSINPWMRPGEWLLDAARHIRSARLAWESLHAALAEAGARIEIIGRPGLPDMVFPANAAVVLDGRVAGRPLPASRAAGRGSRCSCAAFETLRGSRPGGRGGAIAAGRCFQEGAGDCIWDADAPALLGRLRPALGSREAPPSARTSSARRSLPLELATPRFYHLDTCFCPLTGGEVLSITRRPSHRGALAEIRDAVPAEHLIEASDEDAAALLRQRGQHRPHAW